MHVPINVKSPNNISEWQMGFNSAFKGLITVLNTSAVTCPDGYRFSVRQCYLHRGHDKRDKLIIILPNNSERSEHSGCRVWWEGVCPDGVPDSFGKYKISENTGLKRAVTNWNSTQLPW